MFLQVMKEKLGGIVDLSMPSSNVYLLMICYTLIELNLIAVPIQNRL